MKRLAIGAVVLMAACTWSNSLYQARTISHDAMRAERENQPGQAQVLWGTVIIKAESAYAREPRGVRGAEALWLAGHGAVRIRDCGRAIPALQGSLSSMAHPPWEQQLLLELGTCQEALGAPGAAAVYGMLLASATDSAIRHQARLHQGHALVIRGEWSGALAALAGEESPIAHLDRATALAQLGRSDETLQELEPALVAADTAVPWVGYLEILAVHNSAATDSLLRRLVALPALVPARRNALVIAAARAAITFDPQAADRRLLLLGPSSGDRVDEGAMLRQELRLIRPATPAQLRTALDSIAASGGAAPGHAGELARYAKQILAKNDSTAAGSPRGDMVMFALGELARDSLGAPRLGGWFFGRLEHDWPQSPYRAKALFARAALEPDSAEQLLIRVRALPANPYVAAANGDVAGGVQRSRLEDSLSTFVSHLWVSGPIPVQAPEHR